MRIAHNHRRCREVGSRSRRAGRSLAVRLPQSQGQSQWQPQAAKDSRSEESMISLEASQRTAARVVGCIYLFAMATGILGVYAYAHGLVHGAAGAGPIVADEGMLRLNVVCEVITAAADVVLIAALYVVLAPIHRGLALVAVCWRLIETAILLGAVLSSLEVLQIASADQLRALDPERLQALARLPIVGHAVAFNIAFVFLGLGSAVFSYLWLKSRYIPRALAAWGVFSSLLFPLSVLAIIVFPAAKILFPAYMMPLGVFEVAMGFLLLFRGIARRSPLVVARPA
jgi:predicted aconitase with swiveling domain